MNRRNAADAALAKGCLSQKDYQQLQNDLAALDRYYYTRDELGWGKAGASAFGMVGGMVDAGAKAVTGEGRSQPTLDSMLWGTYGGLERPW